MSLTLLQSSKILSGAVRKLAPIIIFFDDAESTFGIRNMADPDNITRMKNELLVRFNELTSGCGIVVIVVTNRLRAIDLAFLDRLAKKIEVLFLRERNTRNFQKVAFFGPSVSQ